jgi:hypothetical protein
VCVIEESHRGADRSPTSRARNGEKSPASPNSDGLMLSPRVDILSPAYRARCGAPRTTSSGFANLWSRIPSPQSTFRRHSCRSGQHNAGLVVPQFEFLFAISAARRKAAIASNSTEKCSASLWYTSIVPVGCPFATSNASITFMSLARPWLKGQENGGVVRSRPCGRKIKDGREVVARGLADTEPAACEQANEAARKANLIA